MFSFISHPYGWLVLVLAAVFLWMVFKFVRSVILKVLGITFTVISLLRLWAFF